VLPKEMSRKQILFLALFLIFVIGAVFFPIRHLRRKEAQARRDAGYARVLSSYRQDLHPGMTRAEVADYLDLHKAKYSTMNGTRDAWAYLIDIGEYPSNVWYCDRWEVYVRFEFNSSPAEHPEVKPLPMDILRRIDLQRLGDCL
jgi:hypothetical protein